MQTDYLEEARKARSQANALNVLAVALTAILFYALTNDPLRTVIATATMGLLSVITANTARLYKSAEVYEGLAKQESQVVKSWNVLDAEKAQKIVEDAIKKAMRE